MSIKKRTKKEKREILERVEKLLDIDYDFDIALIHGEDSLSWPGLRRHADLVKIAQLVGAGLLKIDSLEDFELFSSDFRGLDFSGMNLRGADFWSSNLSCANLANSDLSGADLTGANLTGADLTGASLIKAKLHHANLSSANLTGANLEGAKLRDTNLTGVIGMDKK